MNRRQFVTGALLTGMVASATTIIGKQSQETSLHKEINNMTPIEQWLLNTGKHHLDNDIVSALQSDRKINLV